MVLTLFLQRQGQKLSKNIAIYTVFFSERVQNTVFCDVFQQWALNVPQIPRFSSFFTSSSQSKPAKNTCINIKRNDVLKRFFTIFQLMLLHSKNEHFFLYFCRCSSGLKKALHLYINSTFCLSQSLPQSCSTKN